MSCASVAMQKGIRPWQSTDAMGHGPAEDPQASRPASQNGDLSASMKHMFMHLSILRVDNWQPFAPMFAQPRNRAAPAASAPRPRLLELRYGENTSIASMDIMMFYDFLDEVAGSVVLGRDGAARTSCSARRLCTDQIAVRSDLLYALRTIFTDWAK